MISPLPWLTSAALYAAFRLYYDSWRGRLTQAEIDAYLARAEANGAAEVNDIATVRQFLEADDGREFFMINLVRITPGEVAHPDTGAPTTGQAMMQRYSTVFMHNLIRYGGHPALVMRKAGGYVDAWRVPPDPGWTVVGCMRYRSRRDMIAMASEPVFRDIHKFKIAGVAETFSFPSQPMLRLMAGPRLWVAMLLLLAASFWQIALLA